MNFHEYAKTNRRKTVLFVFLTFMIFSAATTALIFGLGLGAISNNTNTNLLTSVTIGGAISVIVITILYFNFAIIALKMSGAHEADINNYSTLHNVVEEMAIAAGIPKPKVNIIQGDYLNAFAIGTRDKGAVACTEGMIKALNREQLQGVMAHEIGHLKNGDSKLMTIVAGVGAALGIMADIAYYSLFISRNSKNANQATIVIQLIGLMLVIVVAPLLSAIVRASISREREWLADATAVDLTRSPEGLKGALEVLRDNQIVQPKPKRSLAHLWINEPINSAKEKNKHKQSMFSTHPVLEERIERLDRMNYTR